MSKKELLGIVLDVGGPMHRHLDEAGRCLFNAVLAKMLHQPNHEVAVVCYGTAGTRNSVHDEMVEKGEQGYEHISVQHALQTPSLQYLTTLLNLERGPVVGDFVDAIVVTLDMMIRAVTERTALGAFPKRIVVVSNFMGQANDLDEDFKADVVKQMQEAGLKLDILCLYAAPEAAGPHRSKNLDVIDGLLAEVSGDMYTYQQASEIAQYFKARDYSANATYSGPLTIGETVNIGVKVFKKSSKETPPSLKPYSDKSMAPDATHSVQLSRQYKLVSNPDELLGPDEVTRAHRYGKDLVPISKEDTEATQFVPDKGFQVLGFVPVARIPRQHFMKDTSVVVPNVGKTEKMWEANCQALSALVRALHKENKVAIVRCSLRARSALFLGVLSPWLGNNRRPDAFVLNHIPFIDDLREDQEFDMPEQQYEGNQANAVAAFVEALSLGGGPGGAKEQLAPERTINPTLHRFYTTLGHKALDPEAPVAEDEALVQRTFTMQLDRFGPKAAAAVEKLKAAFPIKQFERRPQAPEAGPEVQTRFAAHAAATFNPDGAAEASGRAPEHVGTATPVEDFRLLVTAGKLQQAMEEMPRVVDELLSSSVGDRLYHKAQQCVAAAHEASVSAQQPGPFNDFLKDVCSKYEHHMEHAAFWKHLLQAGAALIDSKTCPSSDISPENAAEFLRIHSASPGGEAAPAAAAEDGKDEFDDFE